VEQEPPLLVSAGASSLALGHREAGRGDTARCWTKLLSIAVPTSLVLVAASLFAARNLF
jgi:hypothetical protein